MPNERKIVLLPDEMDWLFTLKNRIRHFLLAKDEYSLHSPFMFDLFTKGLKAKGRHLPVKGRKSRFIYRLARYFNPKTILVVGDKENRFVDCLNKASSLSYICHCPESESRDWKNDLTKVDFVLLDLQPREKEAKVLFETLLPHCSPESVIILMDTDCNREINSLFEHTKRDERLKICADFGFCGVVFLTQKPLIKQNYCLRTK